MKKTLYQLFIMLALVSTGCVSVAVNHYQDGRSLGKDKADVGMGLATGRTIAFGISRIDSSGYVIEEAEEGPAMPVLNLSLGYGLTPKLDLGGEVFTSLYSHGFRLYGKYAFMDSVSQWGISIMPVVGYAFGNVKSSGSDFLLRSWENEISHGAMIGELPLLISYHISPRAAVTFSPSVYFYRLKSKDETRWIDLDLVERYEASRNFFSPGISLGFQYRGIKPEISFVAVENVTTDKVEWNPYFGIGFYGLENIKTFIGILKALVSS